MPPFNQEKLQKLKRVDGLIKSLYLSPKNKKKYAPINKAEVKEILVIAFLLIGDTIMYIPALRTIKKNYPNAKLTLVCGNLVKTILQDQQIANNYIIANCPWISPFDKSWKNIKSFISTIKKANNKAYDIAIDMRGDWRNIFYMNFIKASRKISFNFSGGEYMLTDVVVPPKRKDHLIDESFSLLEGMDCQFTTADKFPVLTLTNEENDYLHKFKDENNLHDKILIGIHPGASLEERKWDEEKYGKLITRLSQNQEYPPIKFLIFEGPGEKQTVERIITALTGNLVNYIIVNKSLKQYLTIISGCHALVCNDSGAAHVGAAFNIPEVVIFGKGDPKEVKPYSRNILKMASHELECKPCHLINCKFGTNECMKMVTVDEVYDYVDNILGTLIQQQVKITS